MSIYQRNLIKQQQYFYRNYYRRFVAGSLFSMVLSLVLLLAILYVHLTRPAVTFYASSSAGFITPLTPMNKPNNSDNYLLPPDPPEEKTVNTLER